MGTNFYLKSPDAEPLHIGKSSAGWCFSLHVYPEHGIKTLDDWRPMLYDPYAVIEDEYERRISPSKMLEQITLRSWAYAYNYSSEFHEKNYSELGPYGLLRCKVDGVHCIGHGRGTYDYIVGDFS